MNRLFEGFFPYVVAHSGVIDNEGTTSFVVVAVIIAGASILCITIYRLLLFKKQMDNKPLPSPLINYISTTRTSGFHDEVIKQELKTSGWDEALINQALTSPARVSISQTQIEILRLGAVLTFFAHSMIAFLIPLEFERLLEGSFIFHPIIDSFPLLITLVGINDLCIALLLSLDKYLAFVGLWAALWISGVLVVILSQSQGITTSSLIEILAHGAPLGIALFLALPFRW